MSFPDFFQQNILLFGAVAVSFIALIIIEYRGWQTRGANLSTGKLSQKVNNGAKLIDLRRQEDFRAGHIAGAKNLPFEELKNQAETIGNKNDSFVLYCYSGNSSAKMITQLRKLGYSDVSHLRGGMNTWQTDSLPTTKKA